MSAGPHETEQLSLLDPVAAPAAPEPEHPRWAGVAQVLVDTPLAHLDRPFDYGIPEKLDADVRPGVRVRVRFAGVERDGFVLSRDAGPGARPEGRTPRVALQPLRRVVSALPVLTPQVLRLARAVAAHYAGTTSDVLRMAVPPRHAAAEKALLEKSGLTAREAGAPESVSRPEVGEGDLFAAGADAAAEAALAAALPGWSHLPGGAAFLRRLQAGQPLRAVWQALPRIEADSRGPAWADALAGAVGLVAGSGRGVLVVVPDHRDVVAVSAALGAAGVEHETLTAQQGAQARYRRFLMALLGQSRVVVGTRAAAFAPVADLGLVVIWDDGDDAHAEPRAPYPHVREVLRLRAEELDAAMLIGGYARTPEAQQYIETGWARSLVADRAVVRERTPRMVAPDETDLAREGDVGRARIPGRAWQVARDALEHGPVLIQVPRSGYLPTFACQTCRQPARCRHCGGPLGADRADGPARCRWCSRRAEGWSCPECGGHVLRAVRLGSARTAEELGRAFPGVPVHVAGRGTTATDEVDAKPRLVVSTPGAEPVATGGYRAALLLDGAAFTNRPGVSAGTEAVRRWMQAASLVRHDGTVVLLGQPARVPAQALVRWDPVGFAERELAERAELHFPPTTRMAGLTGSRADVQGLLAHLHEPPGLARLGPFPMPTTERDTLDVGAIHVRVLLRVPLEQGLALSTALVGAQGVRSAKKEGGSVRVQIDPEDLV